jgi:glycosyltransferase involved in cell wall biosynthesis
MNELLIRRGHATAVLTSRYRAEEGTGPQPGIYRWLRMESDDLAHYHPGTLFLKPWIEKENRRSLEKIVHQFQPDVILIHSMWNLPRSVAWYAEHLLPGRVVYYIASDWPYRPDAHHTYWNAATRRAWLRWAKKVLSAAPLFYLKLEHRRLALKFEHVLCVSQAVRDDLAHHAGIPFERSCVVHNGIDTMQFRPPEAWDPALWKNGSPAFLYAGGFYHHKGPDLAIEGFSSALGCPEMAGATLTLVGSGNPEYENQLKQLAASRGLNGQVRFLGRVERSEMPVLLGEFDILLVPSKFEALSRIMQEGMASGLVVIGTASWGSKEILRNEENGLAVEPGDPDALAEQIKRAVSDAALRNRVARAGRKTVVEQFDIERMANGIEGYLRQVISQQPVPA